ncbi:MAG: hypothetical protein Kow0077_16940 [Anaerolineae bacterium]
MTYFIALTCEALSRSVYAAAAAAPHPVTVRLFTQGLHTRPPALRETLQAAIDRIDADECAAILLAYGMCGTATVGLVARHTPLVMPRAHDCITLYLGSRERYQQEFERHPGTYWYSVDYMERQNPDAPAAIGGGGLEISPTQYEAYVARYGQDMADMLVAEMQRWMAHYTRAAFVDTGLGDLAAFEEQAKARAAREGWVYERLEGNRRLVEMLVRGEWPEDEFLVVPPGHVIEASHDDRILQVRPVDA